ncbi:BPSS1780 family membrane protein [Piscinibacter sp. XHJ-5]|uniref:BPSS1780 family membrane protein n=1 Tax=Piscinibacter sp. XHJ-5 TaxID=3037797 RepID=UPI0024532EA5|nr:BPSS1780 family membrane protein [Piscinibacter sp. XHJ-5]
MDEMTTRPAGEPRNVEAGRGTGWWTEGWALFTKNAGLWIVLGLILLVVFVVLSFIPFIGWLATSLLAPVFIGSWMLAARKVEGGGTLEVGDLFLAFKGEQMTQLLVVGALLLAGTFVIALVVGMLGFGAAAGMMAGDHSGSAGGMMAAAGAGMLAFLVMMALGVLVAMAFWFAPALVVFRNVAPVDAMKSSFAACLKNIVPMLVYGVLYILAAIVASIPFGLGWIVLVPLVLLTIYVSYKDIYGA